MLERLKQEARDTVKETREELGGAPAKVREFIVSGDIVAVAIGIVFFMLTMGLIVTIGGAALDAVETFRESVIIISP